MSCLIKVIEPELGFEFLIFTLDISLWCNIVRDQTVASLIFYILLRFLQTTYLSYPVCGLLKTCLSVTQSSTHQDLSPESQTLNLPTHKPFSNTHASDNCCSP